MAMTPVSSSTSYCLASRFFDYFDARAVADLVRDDNLPAPTRVQLLDSTDTAGARVVQALLASSGLVEAACTHGNRYLPTDLAALTGASLAHLQRIVALKQCVAAAHEACAGRVHHQHRGGLDGFERFEGQQLRVIAGRTAARSFHRN